MMRLYFDLMHNDGTIDIYRFHEQVLLVNQNDPTTLSDIVGFVIWVVFEVGWTPKMYYSIDLDLLDK